jgi:hypothetical protein
LYLDGHKVDEYGKIPKGITEGHIVKAYVKIGVFICEVKKILNY